MKTNELNNGMKEIYAKPSIEVEEMEVQWDFLDGETFSALTDYVYNAESSWEDIKLELEEMGVTGVPDIDTVGCTTGS